MWTALIIVVTSSLAALAVFFWFQDVWNKPGPTIFAVASFAVAYYYIEMLYFRLAKVPPEIVYSNRDQPKGAAKPKPKP